MVGYHKLKFYRRDFLTMTTPRKSRCAWAFNELLIQYHDKEWGVPVHDDRMLFEFLILEGAQAGLSWHTVLQKRETYRDAFDQFHAEKIARYSPRKIAQLLNNSGIIRNRLKIQAAITNAKAFLVLQDQFASFDQFIWQFVDHCPRQNCWKSSHTLPCSSSQSDAMSRTLKHHGFTFVGTKICYAFMQATGMVGDHVVGCFRFEV